MACLYVTTTNHEGTTYVYSACLPMVAALPLPLTARTGMQLPAMARRKQELEAQKMCTVLKSPTRPSSASSPFPRSRRRTPFHRPNSPPSIHLRPLHLADRHATLLRTRSTHSRRPSPPKSPSFAVSSPLPAACRCGQVTVDRLLQ